MKHKALIVDDEQDARVTLANFLARHCPETIEVIGFAEGVQQALYLIEKKQPTVLFLDIKMGDGTGFDLLKTCKNPSFRVIFTTAYNAYAIRAFRWNAIDYLLKPINPIELKEAVNRLSEVPINTDVHLRHIERYQQNEAPERLVLPAQNQYHIIDINDIIYIESDNNYSIFHLQQHTRVVVSKPLKEYEELLPKAHFFRIHYSFLLNLNYIATIQKKDSKVILTNGTQLEISRRRKQDFLQRMGI